MHGNFRSGPDRIRKNARKPKISLESLPNHMGMIFFTSMFMVEDMVDAFQEK